MKKFYAVMAAVCLLVSSSLRAGEPDSWKSAYQFPHFSPTYAGCDNLALAQMKQLFQARGLPASAWTEMAKSFFDDASPKELVRPFVQGDSALIGLNMRRLGNTLCSDPVLICQSKDKGTCAEMSAVATQHVLQPLWADAQSIIAERDNFAPGDLNPGQSDFVLSHDKGKSWGRINTPVSCGQLGTWCRLIPQNASSYFLLSTQLADDAFADIAIHGTTDGGKSWKLLMEKWKGISDPGAVSYAADAFVSVQAESAEFVTLSRFNPAENKAGQLATDISTRAWSPRFDAQVLAVEGGYLVRLNAASDKVTPDHFGIFLVPSAGQAAASRLIWEVKGVMIGDVQSSEGVIAIRTWNPKSMITGRRFAEQIHYSLDGGTTWQIRDVPAELLGGVMRLAGRKIWLFTAGAVNYLELAR